MTTLTDVQEGKSDFFKVDELEGKEFVFVESLDISKEIRQHTIKIEGKKDATYYDFAIQVDGIVKDVGFTYTALNQLSKVVPKELKNWQGVRINFTGTKGTGKKIKYGWEYLGIAAKGTYQTQQTTIPSGDKNPLASDALNSIVEELKSFSGFFIDNIIPEMNVMQCVEKHGFKGDDAKSMFAKLKDSGRIHWIENTQGKGFRVSE